MQENRYSRHELLKEVGIEGQKRIAQGRVLIIGAGGLGSPASLYLASSGVKKITIVDSIMSKMQIIFLKFREAQWHIGYQMLFLMYSIKAKKV